MLAAKNISCHNCYLTECLAFGIDNPLIVNGFARVPDAPGLGIEALNEDLIREHLHSKYPGQWEPTDSWNDEWANDREWS